MCRDCSVPPSSRALSSRHDTKTPLTEERLTATVQPELIAAPPPHHRVPPVDASVDNAAAASGVGKLHERVHKYRTFHRLRRGRTKNHAHGARHSALGVGTVIVADAMLEAVAPY